MRTTIRLDDGVLAEAKQLAARTGRTLSGIIEDALRAMLANQQGVAERSQVQLPFGQDPVPVGHNQIKERFIARAKSCLGVVKNGANEHKPTIRGARRC